MTSNFMMGLTVEELTALDELETPLPDPQWDYQLYRVMRKLGDLSLKGRGPRTIIWQFPLIEVPMITQLEEFKSDEPIYIQSPKRDDQFAVFEVQPNWPDPRQDGGHRPGFYGHREGLMIEFIVLSEVDGS